MEQHKKINIKKNAIILIFIIIILVAVFFGYKYLKKDKLSYYEEKMIEYGLAEKYNNGTPNDEDNVTKSEAVKMIIEAILNGEDISEHAPTFGNMYYSNLTWVFYGIQTYLIDYDYITEENEADNITCIEAIQMLYKSKNCVFTPREDIQKEVNDEDIIIKHIDEYSQEDIEAINDLISYGILPNKFNYKKDQLLTKKIFNEMLVKFVEKYRM